MPPTAGPTSSRRTHARTRRRTRRRESRWRLPPLRGSRGNRGLYDSRYEHDACGVGFVADLSGRRTHGTVAQALMVLRNLDHRGAKGSDPETGDGAGLLTQIPDAFFRAACGFSLPAAGFYAAGMAFLPTGDSAAAAAKATVERIAAAEGLAVLGWREVPHDPSFCGQGSLAVLPRLAQLFVAAPATAESGLALDRRAFCLRKRTEHEAGLYFASLSSRTIVYKGMLTALQLEPFFPDLSDPAYTSALAMVHSRFSTNTFPSWPLAHPYRFIAHNGEINTVRGNRNWMRAREAMLATDLIPAAADGAGLERLFPILDPDASDSASFDECLELLHLGGRSLPHAILMMIPEPWENHEEMDPARRAFYQFHSTVMEPWDGPACVAFTDGTLIGAVLDRNGLRPSRYWVTDDGLVILASEVGVLDIDPANVVRKGRLQPGRIFLADTARRADPRRRRREGGAGRRAPLPGLAARRPAAPGRPARPGARAAGRRRAHHLAAAGRLHRGGAAGAAGPDGPGRRRAGRVDGHRHAHRGPVRPAAADLRLLHAAVRPGHQPAAGRDQGRAGDLAVVCHRAGGEPARAGASLLPPDRAAVSGDERQRPHQDHPHQRRRGPARVRRAGDRRAFPGRRRRRRAARAAGGDLRRGVGRDRRRRPVHRAVRPRPGRPGRLGPAPGPDPVAAAHRRRPPPPDPGADADQGGPGGGVRRRPRGPPHRAAHRVRRGRGQPLPGAGVGAGHGAARGAGEPFPRPGRRQPDQGAGQGPAQDHVQDGGVHRRLLHRRADLRGDRPGRRGHRHLLRRDHVPARRGRVRRARHRGGPPSRPRVPAPRRGARPPAAGHRRRIPVAPRRRAAPVQPRDRVQAAARDAHPPVRDLQGVHAAG